MTSAATLTAAAWAIVRRDFFVYLSYRARFLSQLLSILFSLALFYYLSKIISTKAFSSPEAYYGYAVVGLAILQMVTSTMVLIPTAVRQELVAGTFEQLLLSPFGGIASIGAMLIFPSLLAVVIAFLTVGIAALGFGLDIQTSTAPLAVPTALLGAVCLAPLSLMLAATVLAVRQVIAGANLLVTLLSIVGGFFFPVALLPSWIRWVSEVQPFTPLVELLRHLLVGSPLSESVWTSILKLVGFAVVFFPVAVAAMGAAIAFSQRRGTITEY